MLVGARLRPSEIVTFVHLPTPLERADRLGAAIGLPAGRLWVKRDDLAGPATGGNKARKLELLVSDALAGGCDVLVTAGGPQSNHCRLTAAAAARVGIHSVLLFNSQPPSRIESNQMLELILGGERRFVGPMALEDLNAVVGRVADELRAGGRRPYEIPIGGSSPRGASAYGAAADEILTQLGHSDVLVITATGSGGTQAGLAARLGHGRVLGIDTGAVTDPSATVRRLAIEVANILGLTPPSGEPRIAQDQIGAGYGEPTQACLRAIRLAARTEGLLLDPVYSGKAMAGLGALPQSALQAAAIVFLASGGVPALFESRFAGWLSGPG
jgi:1-aminocyclopropane-1-carboxylate deaminase/D-cysteine desulfhydrase-like pyridoxal-dependent ACC family enzyme